MMASLSITIRLIWVKSEPRLPILPFHAWRWNSLPDPELSTPYLLFLSTPSSFALTVSALSLRRTVSWWDNLSMSLGSNLSFLWFRRDFHLGGNLSKVQTTMFTASMARSARNHHA